MRAFGLVVDLDSRPMEGISVLEPLEHSVLDVDLGGGSYGGWIQALNR